MTALAPASPLGRAIAAVAAVAVSVLLIAALGIVDGVPRDRPGDGVRPFVTVLLPPATEPARSAAAERARRPAATVAPRPSAVRPARERNVEPPRPHRDQSSITLPPAAPPIADRPAAAEAVAVAPTPASAARLRLDPATLRAAASASRSSVAEMAGQAGRDLASSTGGGDAPGSRLQRAVGAAGRADCLAPDEQASLLSAVALAARALAGRCS